MQRLSLRRQEKTSLGKPNVFTASSLSEEVPSSLDEAWVLEVVQGQVGKGVQMQGPSEGSEFTQNREQR